MSRASFASINGAEIYYEIEGRGEPTLVFIHAGICDSRQWDEQMPYFTPRHRVVRFDRVGFGQSAVAQRTVDTQRADIAALFDQLEVNNAVLIGSSQGGALALDYALENPKRVSGLVLLGSALNGFEFDDSDPEPEGWADIVQAWKEGRPEPVNEYEMTLFLDGRGQPRMRLNPELRAKAAAMNLIALQNQLLSESQNIQPEPELQPPAAMRLHEITVPVLMMVGDYDTPYIRAAAAAIMAGIPDIQRIDLPTAHLPNMEMPDAFNLHVEDFLKAL
jgi:3-oxoadipate enol-lactonase